MRFLKALSLFGLVHFFSVCTKVLCLYKQSLQFCTQLPVLNSLLFLDDAAFSVSGSMLSCLC